MVSPGPLLYDSYFKDIISTGQYLLPQYVHAMILASEITIYFPKLGSWEHSDDQGSSVVLNALMEYAFAERLSGSFGPFNFDIHEMQATGDHNFHVRRKRFNGGIVVTLPGTQLVGYIMNIVPKFPSEQIGLRRFPSTCECEEAYKLINCKGEGKLREQNSAR